MANPARRSGNPHPRHRHSKAHLCHNRAAKLAAHKAQTATRAAPKAAPATKAAPAKKTASAQKKPAAKRQHSHKAKPRKAGC